MTLKIEAEAPHLEVDRDGVARVSGSRVTLDTVVGAFQRGATAEEIMLQYPTLSLADIYAVIAYYLHHTPDVDAYLEERREFGRRVRQENEARSDLTGIRERLLARRTQGIVPPNATIND